MCQNYLKPNLGKKNYGNENPISLRYTCKNPWDDIYINLNYPIVSSKWGYESGLVIYVFIFASKNTTGKIIQMVWAVFVVCIAFFKINILVFIAYLCIINTYIWFLWKNIHRSLLPIVCYKDQWGFKMIYVFLS